MHTQTKQAKHTALPWRVRQSILRSNPQIEQDSDSHYQICVTLDHKETDEANVAFIVRSVNSHEELLAFAQMIANGGLDATSHETIEAEARLVITHATGE